MTDQQENAAFDAKAHLEELLSNMPLGDVASMILAERADASKVRALADERLVGLDRSREKVARLENELGIAKAEARIFSNDRDSLRRQLDHAQGAAMEMRGRLLAAHAEQMVRRGDVGPLQLPNVYGGYEEVSF